MKENWVIPCNVNHLDLDKHLLKTNEVVFKEPRPKNVGDTAYIYVSGIKGQLGEIKYKGTVIDNHCSQEILEKHSYAVLADSYSQGPFKYMLVRIESKFPDGCITFDDLKRLDFAQVRSQTRTTRKLQAFLDEKENLLTRICTKQL